MEGKQLRRISQPFFKSKQNSVLIAFFSMQRNSQSLKFLARSSVSKNDGDYQKNWLRFVYSWNTWDNLEAIFLCWCAINTLSNFKNLRLLVDAGHRAVMFDRFNGVLPTSRTEGLNWKIPFLQVFRNNLEIIF